MGAVRWLAVSSELSSATADALSKRIPLKPGNYPKTRRVPTVNCTLRWVLSGEALQVFGLKLSWSQRSWTDSGVERDMFVFQEVVQSCHAAQSTPTTLFETTFFR